MKINMPSAIPIKVVRSSSGQPPSLERYMAAGSEKAKTDCEKEMPCFRKLLSARCHIVYPLHGNDRFAIRILILYK